MTKGNPLDEADKAKYASCVGSAIYLSQDRYDIKFSVKELAKGTREPRECDLQNFITSWKVPERNQRVRTREKI